MSERQGVLVVEDEMMIAMMIEDMLNELGYDVVGPATRIEEAMALIGGGVAAALLDVNIAGQPVYPVAEALQQQGIPLIFLTGYGTAGVDPRFQGCPVLPKPFELSGLQSALAAIIPAR